jgi:3-oxoacyl-[acyl-carrier-protein] synthase-3
LHERFDKENMMRKSAILGIGHYVPPKVVTNQDLERIMDTTDEWIQQRTGIEERRYVDEGIGASDLALEASRKALEMAGMEPSDLDLIIYATLSPDHNFPGDGCFLQEKLGLSEIGALDIRNQCTGFVYGLSIADQYIKTGYYDTILLVGAECHSTALDFSVRGRDITVLFGDGAGAVVIGPSKNGPSEVLSTHLHAEGKYARDLWLEYPASRYHPRITAKALEEGRHHPKMKGRMVFKHAVTRMPETIIEALNHNSLKVEDVDMFIFHQANLRINQAVARALNIGEEHVYNNIQKYGNTTAASLPIALDEMVRAGRVTRGDLVCLVAFGAGFTWGSALLRW